MDLDHPAVLAALDDLGARIVAAPAVVGGAGRAPFWKRRRMVLVGAALAAALAAGFGAPATADWLRDGPTPNGGELDRSQRVLIDSPQFVETVKRAAKDYPTPPGGTVARAITVMRYERSGPRSDLYLSTAAIRIDVALDSASQWQGYWLAGQRRGDATQMKAGRRGLDAVAHWQLLITWSDDDGKFNRRIADAARRGDVRPIAEAYAPYTTPIPAFTWPNPDLQKLRSATRAPR
jgi:hypothetical protein